MHNPKSAVSFLIARAKSLQLRHHNYRFLTSTSRSLLFTPFISKRFFSGHYNIEQFSDDEYDCDFENHQVFPFRYSIFNFFFIFGFARNVMFDDLCICLVYLELEIWNSVEMIFLFRFFNFMLD
jgi:hypothetical protein